MPEAATNPVSSGTDQTLDSLHHIAISVEDIAVAVNWYMAHFRCVVKYQDSTWALLGFRNVNVALVVPEQHPPHLAFTSPNAAGFGELKKHRDGTRSVYITDPSSNTVELMAED